MMIRITVDAARMMGDQTSKRSPANRGRSRPTPLNAKDAHNAAPKIIGKVKINTMPRRESLFSGRCHSYHTGHQKPSTPTTIATASRIIKSLRGLADETNERINSEKG